MIYYLGPEGSYSHQAALLLSLDTSPVNSIKEVFLKSSTAMGVVPWENSLEGSITETLDLLLETDLFVVGELNLKISHCLLGYLDNLEGVEANTIYSHPQAIAQCRGYLYEKGYNAVPINSTALGVLEAKKRRALAIGSIEAAKVYDIPVLEVDIQDRKDNSTRFAVLAKVIPPKTGNDKTSIIFSTYNDKPGALYQILSIFARENINLTRIESRPTKRYLGEYLFHIDLLGHKDDPLLSKVLDEVKEKTSFVKVLGSYPLWDSSKSNKKSV